jgi:hypothetical protein
LVVFAASAHAARLRTLVSRNRSYEKGRATDAGPSITADKPQKAKRKVPSGQGDRDDRA